MTRQGHTAGEWRSALSRNLNAPPPTPSGCRTRAIQRERSATPAPARREDCAPGLQRVRSPTSPRGVRLRGRPRAPRPRAPAAGAAGPSPRPPSGGAARGPRGRARPARCPGAAAGSPGPACPGYCAAAPCCPGPRATCS